MRVIVDYQTDWLWNHLGDKLQGIPVSNYLHKINQDGKSHPKGGHYHVGLNPKLHVSGKLAEC